MSGILSVTFSAAVCKEWDLANTNCRLTQFSVLLHDNDKPRQE